jgi:hypothetical protein
MQQDFSHWSKPTGYRLASGDFGPFPFDNSGWPWNSDFPFVVSNGLNYAEED